MAVSAKGRSQFLRPRSLDLIRSWSWKGALRDATAGVAVGLVALPLAMAFAISSGLKPEAGLYCAIIAGFLVSLLGGSTTQIGGPTGAFVVVVSGIVREHGVEGLYMCTLMAGVMLAAMGLARLGSAVRFIPRPVILGFTNGIAVLIASTQVKDAFGLQMTGSPEDFLGRMAALAGAFGTAAWPAAALALGSVALMIALRRWLPAVPGAVAALILGTLAASAFHLPVETIQSKFGGIPSGLPSLHLPQFRPDLILGLLSPAITVAMLGAIESLLSAVVADQQTGDRHDPNTELFAQGIANIASPLFGGLPATGAIARTATSIRSGARTPLAGMVHALTLLAILLFAAPLAGQAPLAVLAGILLMVAWHMGEWKEVPRVWKAGRGDLLIWLITFALTVLADLSVAVQAGMILAALVFIHRVTRTTSISRITEEGVAKDEVHSLQGRTLPAGVSAFRIHGPFLFGATEKLEDLKAEIDAMEPIILLRLRNMTAIDGTGIQALESFASTTAASGRSLLICGARTQPAQMIARSRLREIIGQEQICDSYQSALLRVAGLQAVDSGSDH